MTVAVRYVSSPTFISLVSGSREMPLTSTGATTTLQVAILSSRIATSVVEPRLPLFMRVKVILPASTETPSTIATSVSTREYSTSDNLFSGSTSSTAEALPLMGTETSPSTKLTETSIVLFSGPIHDTGASKNSGRTARMNDTDDFISLISIGGEGTLSLLAYVRPR